MKRIFAIILMAVLMFSGCTNVQYGDVTPPEQAVERICMQRTDISENKTYTYYEKTIDDKQAIEAFMGKIDALKLIAVEPIKYKSAEFLIVFEGKRSHKLIVSENYVIYDGLAFRYEKKDLFADVSALYNEIGTAETVAQSKLFK